ncbi:MAG: helix-turn-helix domain-containing protein [Sedimentisphaerales bacterium]|jgi:excisionase family DNA binding protein
MAGMFFSIQEVAAKLGKSEDEIRQIVKSGRLREFRDGPNLLFKVDEVNALLSDTSFTGVRPTPPAAKPAAPKSEEAEAEEILLAPEGETPGKDNEELQLTDADTQIVDEGIKVLGDTTSLGKGDSDETFKGSGSGTPGKEASLEEIEKDVSLDTFGSGSGLLDLSLQADDTSLGGILDEIYTPGAAGEGKAPAAAEPAAAAESASAEGSAMEIAAEADQMQFPEAQAPAPALAMAIAYAEPEPDAMSNALGVMLFIPFVAVIYTAMAAVAGFSNLNLAILKMSQGFIWYIVIGMAVASGLIMAVGATMGKEKKPKVPKPPKVKKEKPPKPVKEKKGK